jgi:hypothetical protein
MAKGKEKGKGPKRERKRIPKAERRSLRLWAEGLHEMVLTPHIEPYAVELQKGWRYERDYLQTVTREFHARISWRLADHEEPDSLPDFDPKTMVLSEKLSDNEESARSARVKVLDDVCVTPCT